MTIGSRPPGSPTSLVNPTADTAAERRYLAGRTTDTGAPDNSGDEDARLRQGVGTYNKRWLHVGVQLLDAASSCKVRVYVFNRVSSLWCLDTRFGTSGTLTLAYADSPQTKILEIDGFDRVFVELDDCAMMTNGVNVWLATSGEVDAG